MSVLPGAGNGGSVTATTLRPGASRPWRLDTVTRVSTHIGAEPGDIAPHVLMPGDPLRARWIAEHYDEDPEFFLKFLDSDYRCYSQGVFERDDEPLEAGIRRKLEFAWDQIGVKEGDRVLDVGGGWGAWTQFAGERGVRVTSLTISKASEAFINGLIGGKALPCRVVREHLFAHQPGEKYDAIVNLGVTEHLPDYAATLRKYASLLKPGGRVCLDASATRRKYAVSAFFERHIFPGNGSPVCIHDYLAQVAASPFSVMGVYNDTHNYELTTRHWARNLDAHRAEIEARFGTTQYRRFQVYLWGCVDGFQRDVVQAYRWVLELTGDPADPAGWKAA